MAEDGREEVCVLIPTYNEAATIGEVIDGFTQRGLTNVLVVDGHSTDDTREIAREHGAQVMKQSGNGRGSGKGEAVREGIEHVEAPYVLMLDGDGTYRPEDADRMLAPLLSGQADHVVGDRFAEMEPGAMPRLNRLGNGIINRAFNFVHGRDLGDILSGYRAFTRESVERFGLTATGFEIETELSVECVKHNVETAVVPIVYRARPDDSDPNLSPFNDGARIILTLYQLAKTNNPLFYFGSVGILSLLSGAGIAVYVAVEWITRGISHEVWALVSAFGILLGVQLLIFGLLSDMIVSLHREQLRRLRQVETGRATTPVRRGQDPTVEGPLGPVEPGDGTDDGADDAGAVDAEGERTDADADPRDPDTDADPRREDAETATDGSGTSGD